MRQPGFAAALGNEVEVVVRRVHHVDPAPEGRVRAKNGAALVLREHADAGHVRIGVLELGEVVGGVAAGQGVGFERDLEVVVEIGALRGYPLESPAEALGKGLQLGERRARDGGEGNVALTEMGGDAVEVVG